MFWLKRSNKLKDEPWQLLVVGDGSEREAFERQLCDYGLARSR